ncbi:hypothetical protein [Pararhizobium sp.]|uniref:hypothetical protein n=1 Tax=Pararhizobium sp. TaxID=1977563 RepID=UPI003BAAC168
MTLQNTILGIIGVVAVGIMSVWSYQLQIATTAIPAEFAFTGIERLREDDSLSADGASAETTETYARPLFSKNRRPFQTAETTEPDLQPAPPVMVEEETSAVAVERPQLKLLGTESVAKMPSALITMEDTGTSAWFHQGDLITGWRITRIRTDDIELSHETDRSLSFNLSLYPDAQ